MMGIAIDRSEFPRYREWKPEYGGRIVCLRGPPCGSGQPGRSTRQEGARADNPGLHPRRRGEAPAQFAVFARRVLQHGVRHRGYPPVREADG